MRSLLGRRAVAAAAALLLAFGVTRPIERRSHTTTIEAQTISAERTVGWDFGAAVSSTVLTVPPTTVPPAPPPSVRVHVVSARTARVAPVPSTDLLQRANEALASVIPPAWRDAVHPWLVLIDGNTSWSATTGRIRVARLHASGPYERLRAIMAHEWGHQVAFKYGTQQYLGAPPQGWPYSGDRPAEAWGDCVAQTLTGTNPSRRAGECDSAALQFIRDWLARGPGG